MIHVPEQAKVLKFWFNRDEHVTTIDCTGLRRLLVEEFFKFRADGGRFSWEHYPRVLVGIETFAKVTDSIAQAHTRYDPLTFRIDCPLFNYRYRRAEIGGFTLYVLPWFKEGMIFLPENLDEKL